MIQKGFSVNQKTREGLSPLYVAAKAGFYEIVEILLRNGARINDCIFNIQQPWMPIDSPLHTATNNGYLEIVKLLVENGAEMNRQIEDGETPLSIAVSREKLEIAKYLLQRGANTKLFHDNPLLCRAVETSNVEMVKLLIEVGGCDVEQQTLDNTKLTHINKITPLILATQRNNIQLVQILVKYGADIKNSTALFVAAERGHAEVTKELIKLGAEVDEIGENNFTPLYVAVKFNKEEVVKILLEEGQSKAVNIFGNTNRTPALHVACLNGAFRIAKLLLKHGAEV